MTSGRYFAVTVLGGKLYLRTGPERLDFQPEEVVDRLLETYGPTGHRKVLSADELQVVLRASGDNIGAVTIWVHQELEAAVRRISGDERYHS